MAGYDVTGVDIEQAILERAARKISVNCQQMVEEGMFSEKQAAEIKFRISLTLDWDEAVAAADYITEAVPEEMRTKQAVFNKCGEICPENVVVASNTSSMSITEIASEMKYPRRAISTHWDHTRPFEPHGRSHLRGENVYRDKRSCGFPVSGNRQRADRLQRLSRFHS